MDKRICQVLLVDDSDDDRFLLQRSLKSHAGFRVVAEVRDGEDAIRYIAGESIFSDRERYPFPDLVLLDLKMPRKTGYEVLAWLQTQAFEKLRVVVLSGSFLPEDVAKSLELGAHAYHMKTALGPGQTALIEKLEAVASGWKQPREANANDVLFGQREPTASGP
jgi:CheY-like chemotaxis protein